MTPDQKEAMASLSGGVVAYRDCAKFAGALSKHTTTSFESDLYGERAARLIRLAVSKTLESFAESMNAKADNLEFLISGENRSIQ